MKTTLFMKKCLCIALSLSFLFTLSACITVKNTYTDNETYAEHDTSPEEEMYAENDVFFTKTEDGRLISPSGTEYVHLANEGFLYYFGDLTFLGGVEGETKESQHLGFSYQTGLFSISTDESHNILVRRSPNNEWFSIYRKATLAPFDYSVDNCVRLEFVIEDGYLERDEAHMTCGSGLTNKTEIATFLTAVRAQQNPRDAGLYDMITKPDGMLRNCYVYGVVYGFFEEEPNIVVRMVITSYNDLAYSIQIEGQEYVLPDEWLQRLQKAS